MNIPDRLPLSSLQSLQEGSLLQHGMNLRQGQTKSVMSIALVIAVAHAVARMDVGDLKSLMRIIVLLSNTTRASTASAVTSQLRLFKGEKPILISFHAEAVNMWNVLPSKSPACSFLSELVFSRTRHTNARRWVISSRRRTSTSTPSSS